MDYRLAKQIRGAKFTDLMAANIVKGGSTIGSFGKAFSQKSKARATRIKEKFDPLNIAKFLTGGSKLAPAILGRLLGRSQRDIEYFSGTARLIGGANTRIGTVDKQGSELGILTDIYKFLKKSYDDDKKQKDLLSDFAEEKKLEDDRRHKELINAIKSARTYTPMIENEKAAGGKFLDMIKGLFENFKNSIGGLVEKVLQKMFGGAKSLGKLLKFLGSRVFGLLLGPLAGAASIIALVLLLAEAMRWAIGKLPDFAETITQQEASDFLRNASEYDKQKLAKSFKGGMAELEAKAVGGKENAKAILESGDEVAIQSAGGRELLERVAGVAAPKTEPLRVDPRPGGLGLSSKLEERAKQTDWDTKYAGKYDPFTGYKLGYQMKPGDEDITAPKNFTITREPPAGPAASPKMGSFNRMPGASTTPMQMAQPASSAGSGSNLSGAVDQNQNLRLDERMASNAPPATRSVTSATPRASSVVQRTPIPPVRNMEESFQRMIYNSIRVV